MTNKQDDLLEQYRKIKQELEIRDIQVSDLESELIKEKTNLENTVGLANSLRKEILEYENKERERALKYNNIKKKIGPLYSIVLKIKKIIEK